MAQQNPLKSENPLKPKVDFTLKKEIKVQGCPRCKSTKTEEYSHLNGTGKSCKNCNHYWPVGHFGGLSQSETRKFAEESREYKESILVSIQPDFALPETELQNIEETIENNENFFRRRLYGDY